ncbi:hypothetical protein EZV62_018667 [Acer yangbiense]|uniref:Disease resistance N-terminal domain-containing protein n=1 Tax=Acer yangbiense TaxID=1000413 RepID=A0A5C7HKC3_9ROSI|nr:hypothetical protein EZV62_018667 [Acer yangbiense]
MAEAIVSPIAEILLGKLGSLVYQEACLIWGFKTDLLKLERTLKTIKAVLLDAEQQQLHNHGVRVWLEELKDVCYDAEDVLDAFEIETLQRQAMVNRGSITQKVWNYLSWPNSVAFRFTIGHKIKEIRERLDEIAADKAKFHLTDRVDNRNAHREREMTHSFVFDSEVIGRDKEKEEIIELLTQSNDAAAAQSHLSSNSKNMAEAIVSPIAEILLGKLGSHACQEASLIWGFKSDLLKLERTLNTIKAVLLDAEQQLHNHEIRAWLEELKDVCYDAEDVLDEFEIQALQRKATVNRGTITQKVWNYLSWPKSVSFRFTIGHKIKEIRERLDEIAADKAKFHLTDRVDNRNSHREREMAHSFVFDSDVIGRDKEKEDIIELLTQPSDVLGISGCENLEYLCGDIGSLKALQTMAINQIEMDSRQDLNSSRIQLRSILIQELPNLEEFPQWLLHDNTLEALDIRECPNFIAFPESLQNLQSLQHLFIWDCPKLISLPEGMHRLIALRRLVIGGDCPALIERCKKDTGEDWPNIAHIPWIRIDDEVIQSPIY